jgi:hypothetical protein
MERIIAIAAVALLLGAALPVGAQAKARAGQEIDDVTEYTFPDESVVGGLPGADDVRIVVRPKPKARSLIQVRTNFVHAMLKSVEDI